MNLLVSTLGITPEIIEETLAFFTNDQKDWYQDKANYAAICQMRRACGLNSHSVDEVWMIATADVWESKLAKVSCACSPYGVRLRMFVLEGVADIRSQRDADAFHDLVLRVTAHARKLTGSGKLYLSLACGRKTMSADIQDAAYCYGCDMLLHVLGGPGQDVLPVSLGAFPQNDVLRIPEQTFPQGEIVLCKPEMALLETIREQRRSSQSFYTTYYLRREETRSNFHVLYTLPPSKIEALKEARLGLDPEKAEAELAWLRRLPKTDLHCHLGGALQPQEIIETAHCYREAIHEICVSNAAFSEWYSTFILADSLATMKWKEYRDRIAKELGVGKSIITAAVVLRLAETDGALERFIYGSLLDGETAFSGIGIDHYEKLGDLQGSSLLCSEAAVRSAVQQLLADCRRENVRYLELRCSPLNYVIDGFPAEKVLQCILEELDKEPEVLSSILLIASRHGDLTKISQSIKLVDTMRGNTLFKKYFRGFDLAGNESACSPKEVREQFLEIMKDCYNITIHAGETMPVENIWEAVYHLNAERIGHGLKLLANEELSRKLLERDIGVEMCPSSNSQINSYSDNYHPESAAGKEAYPLKEYLDRELLVSVNTDDPGISLTDASHELLRAARLTPGGLTQWDILQLICNGFRSAFYPYAEKKKLIRMAEEDLGRLMSEGLL